jgi:imidazolonepropionase-like amidohydrolase
VIDGTGASPNPDATLLTADGKIESLGSAQSTPLTSVTQTLNLTGRAVMPGLVGMHDHLFYGSVGLIQAIRAVRRST